MLVEAIQSALDISFASFGPRGLVLSDDQLVERLITNIPYFSIGPLGFAIATFLFTLHKSTKPALYVLASILFAFLASVLDFNQLLQRSNGSMPVKETINTLTLARELGFAVSVCARFLFFWHYAALPPQGEVVLPPRQRIRALPGNAEQHSASYSQWGPFGIFLNWLHLFAAIAVGVLELLWRISTTAPFNPVYRADGILQIVLSALFSIKLLANVWLSPLSPRWKTLRNYLPVLVAIWIGAGVAIGNLIVFTFSDMSLGRFLQAIELYVLALLILITAGSKRADRTSLVVEDSNTARPRSTFLGLPQRSTVGSGFRVSPPTISTPDLANDPPARPAAPSRMSTAERLASWLSQRIAVVRADREQDRLWNRSDLEAMGVADEKRRSATSYSEQSPLEPQQVVPWASSLAPKPAAPSILVAKASELPSQQAATAAPDVSKRTSLRPPSPVFRVTTDYSQNGSRSTNRPDSVTRGESPIYGLNTPPPRMIGQRAKELYSPSLESLMREQERLDKSVANLKLLSPSPGTGQTPGVDLAPPTTTARTESESYRSEFSLSNFPSPPAGAFFTNGSSIKTHSDSRSGSGGSAPEVPSQPSPNAQPQSVKEDVVMDDVTFTLIPPRMPVAMEEGRQSVPSTSGGSLPEFMDSLGSNRGDSSVTQYNVTSFIGDLSSPRAGGYPSSIITGLADVPHSPSPPSPMTAGEYFDKISKGLEKDFAQSLSPQQTLSPITPALTSATTVSPIERPRAALKLNTSLPSNPRANADSAKVAGNPRYIPFSAGRPRLDISSPISRNSRNEPLNSFERPRPAPLVLTLAKPGQGAPDNGKFI